MLAERVHQDTGAEAYHIGSWQPRLIFRLPQGIAGLLLAQVESHQGQANDFAGPFGPHPAYRILVERKHALQRGEGTMSIALNFCCPGLVAEDHGIRHGPMNQSQCYWRIARMIQGSLALDKDPIILSSEIEHHFFHHSRHEVTDDTIYR